MNTVADPKTSYDFSGLGALKAQAARDRGNDETIQKTAQQFEAMFLQMIMKSMRATIQEGGLLDSGQTKTFEQMLDQQFAIAMAGRRSTGLSQMIENFIRQSQGQGPDQGPETNKKFSLDGPETDGLPLVNESDALRLPEGSAQQFLLNRGRLSLGGGN
jgi:Rod binding domain-containing protein